MNLAQSKISLRKRVGRIQKAHRQEHRSYDYASHEDITDTVVPVMHELGVTHTVTTIFEFHDGVIFITARITFHADGENESVDFMAAAKLVDGTTAGAVTSYAIKVAFLKYWGLTCGDRDDLERIQERDDHATKRQPPPREEFSEFEGLGLPQVREIKTTNKKEIDW